MLDIEDLHPLRNSITLKDIVQPIFPFRLCIKKSKKKNLRFALRKAILAEMSKIGESEHGNKEKKTLKVSELDEEMQTEPFLQFGFGITAYFDIISSVIIMMIMLTIFCIPIYLMYANG